MLDVGIHIGGECSDLAATLGAVLRHAPAARVFFIVEPDADLRRCSIPASVRVAHAPRGGGATAFNTLLGLATAPAVAFLESGAQVTAGALGRLQAALQGSVAFAGPSTNFARNNQRQSGAPSAAAGFRAVEHFAAGLAWRQGIAAQELPSQRALCAFCLVVRRQVIAALGGADDAYDPGPMWEVDLILRARAAGWHGVWVKGAYVHRATPARWKMARENEFAVHNRRRFQERFCGGFLRGTRIHHCQGCLGDACEEFAPVELIRTTIPSEVRAPALAVEVCAAATPLVSCIVPTHARPAFLIEAVRVFLAQDYPRRELIVVDDGPEPVGGVLPRDERIRYFYLAHQETIGVKRNFACSEARGELIAHFDDDDWYPPHRLTLQVRALLEQGGAICGTSTIYLMAPSQERAWCFSYPNRGWVAGTTLLYRRALWAQHPFPQVDNGEDASFIRGSAGRGAVVDLGDPTLCVATIHTGNTSGRHGGDRYRREVDLARVRALLGERAAAYRDAAIDPRAMTPLASCIMPTCNRPEFAALALSRFGEQDYPRKELIVVDDGSESIEALVRADANPEVRHRRLELRGASVGEKRNIACELALGDFICMWDDDDWYAPNRLSMQVTPLLYDQADITGLRCDCLLCLPSGAAWAVTDTVHQRMFESDVTGGTIAFQREVLRWVKFPPINLAEDAAFIRMARARGYRLQRIAGHEAFVYVRHMHNTWQFEPGRSFDPKGWRRGEPPAGMSAETLAQYSQACTTWLRRVCPAKE